MRSITSSLRRNAARLLSQDNLSSEAPQAYSRYDIDATSTAKALELASRDPDVMALDAQTFKDLEVFDSILEGASLFELCNFTRSKSGARALRERMLRPWNKPEKILAVQQSLQFISDKRELFDSLPGYVTTQIVDKYVHNSLPPLIGRNPVDFALRVIDLISTDGRRFDVITQGVGVTASFLHLLNDMVSSEELKAVQHCELADLLWEIRQLLSHERLRPFATAREWGIGAWKTLRTDQIFRYHEKNSVIRLLQLVYELDALISLSDATRKHGFVMPEIASGPLAVKAEGLVHPHVKNAVANPVELDQQHRLLFLTGPNMAGKTTYLRAFAVALYFAHLGMGVPAGRFCFVPAEKLFSSITLSDNLHAGVSFFQAEGLRVKSIAKALNEGYKVVAIMDEPFKGTNVKDAFDASRAILERLAARDGCLFMFSSHLIELSEHFTSIRNVDCRYFEARENTEGKLSFEYVLRPGVSSQRLGMRVLEEEGIFDLLDGHH